MNFDEIRKELAALSHMEVLVFGSFVTGTHRPESDIDIAILSHSDNNEDWYELKSSLLGKIPFGYDISIFEGLPTVYKSGVLEDYEVLFGDPLEIGEYLQKYWRECEDYSFRLEVPSLDEIRQGVNRFKRTLE